MRLISALLLAGLVIIFLVGCSGREPQPVLPPEETQVNSLNQDSRSLESFQEPSTAYWSEMIRFENEFWLARINENGTIHRAFGKGVMLDQSPEQIIDSHQDIFRIPSSSMKKVEEYTQDKIHYVFYRQVVNEIEVKDSRVELRWGRNGALMLVGADVFPDLNINTTPNITDSEAIDIARRDSGLDVFSWELVIENQNDSFYLVWWVNTEKYRYHINAWDGFILEKENNFIEDHEWMTEVTVYPLSPFDTPVEIPYPDELSLVDIPGTGDVSYYADPNGNTNVISEEEFLNVQSFLDSPYVNAIPCQDIYPEGKIDWTSTNAQPQSVLFDDSNSEMGQRMVGYFSNKSHNYIKNIDPTYTGMDFMLDAHADCCCTCNAFAYIQPPYKIMMYLETPDCVPTSEVADVIVHEYGHIYVAVQYTLGRPLMSIHEGFSDVLANAVTQQPEIGKNIRGVGTNFRSSVNTVLYDNNNCYGGSHCLGNILAGALWEIRTQLGSPYVDHLWHQARFAQSNSFEDFVVDFYMIDDNDDNILNGTPNTDIFYQCFWDNHHIPVPATPNIPTERIVVDIVPTHFPLEMDRTKSNNNLFYEIKIKNLNDTETSFQIWAMVETPWDFKYGPMIPPTIIIRAPLTLTLQPDQEINVNLRHAIPGMVPAGEYRYHVRAGEFVDNVNDVLIDDDWLDFEMY